MQYLDPKIIKRIEDKLQKINNLRPLPKVAVQKLQEQFSNRNDLSLKCN